jgi:hypothetical protein
MAMAIIFDGARATSARPKVDGFVPGTQNVSLKRVPQAAEHLALLARPLYHLHPERDFFLLNL